MLSSFRDGKIIWSVDVRHAIKYTFFLEQLLAEPDQEVVLLSQVLAHSCNIGYETQRNLVLSKCNGELVRSLKHLKQVDVMYVLYVCMYITCTVQHIYFTAEMYVVVLYTDDVQLLHGIFLIYDQCIYSPENRYTIIFSLNTDEVRQRTRL